MVSSAGVHTWALRNFQEKFGLPVDGLAGAKTKQMHRRQRKYDKSTANKGTTTNKGK